VVGEPYVVMTRRKVGPGDTLPPWEVVTTTNLAHVLATVAGRSAAYDVVVATVTWTTSGAQL